MYITYEKNTNKTKILGIKDCLPNLGNVMCIFCLYNVSSLTA